MRIKVIIKGVNYIKCTFQIRQPTFSLFQKAKGKNAISLPNKGQHSYNSKTSQIYGLIFVQTPFKFHLNGIMERERKKIQQRYGNKSGIWAFIRGQISHFTLHISTHHFTFLHSPWFAKTSRKEIKGKKIKKRVARKFYISAFPRTGCGSSDSRRVPAGAAGGVLSMR